MADDLEWTENSIADWSHHPAHASTPASGIYLVTNVRRENGSGTADFRDLCTWDLYTNISYLDGQCVAVWREPTDEELAAIAKNTLLYG